MRLLSTPLPVMTPFFWALKAVASSLKYCTRVPGSGPFEKDLRFSLEKLSATGHGAILEVAAGTGPRGDLAQDADVLRCAIAAATGCR